MSIYVLTNPMVSPLLLCSTFSQLFSLAHTELGRWLKLQGLSNPALLRGAVGAALCSASDLLQVCMVFGEGAHAGARSTNL